MFAAFGSQSGSGLSGVGKNRIHLGNGWFMIDREQQLEILFVEGFNDFMSEEFFFEHPGMTMSQIEELYCRF